MRRKKQRESCKNKPKGSKEGTHAHIKAEEAKDWRCASVACLRDYSYRAAEELMRCVIRQI